MADRRHTVPTRWRFSLLPGYHDTRKQFSQRLHFAAYQGSSVPSGTSTMPATNILNLIVASRSEWNGVGRCFPANFRCWFWFSYTRFPSLSTKAGLTIEITVMPSESTFFMLFLLNFCSTLTINSQHVHLNNVT